jgi:hypothetical protein
MSASRNKVLLALRQPLVAGRREVVKGLVREIGKTLVLGVQLFGVVFCKGEELALGYTFRWHSSPPSVQRFNVQVEQVASRRACGR